MSRNKLLLAIVLIIVAIGCLVAVNLTAITIADIQYGDWAKITHPDGTFFYVSWADHMSDEETRKQHAAAMEENGFKLERVTGYGVRISKMSSMQKKPSTGRIHLFDTEETAIRFAKENGIPDERIIVSNQDSEGLQPRP